MRKSSVWSNHSLPRRQRANNGRRKNHGAASSLVAIDYAVQPAHAVVAGDGGERGLLVVFAAAGSRGAVWADPAATSAAGAAGEGRANRKEAMAGAAIR